MAEPTAMERAKHVYGQWLDRGGSKPVMLENLIAAAIEAAEARGRSEERAAVVKYLKCSGAIITGNPSIEWGTPIMCGVNPPLTMKRASDAITRGDHLGARDDE